LSPSRADGRASQLLVIGESSNVWHADKISAINRETWTWRKTQLQLGDPTVYLTEGDIAEDRLGDFPPRASARQRCTADPTGPALVATQPADGTEFHESVTGALYRRRTIAQKNLLI
jgi:hypothetical protein